MDSGANVCTRCGKLRIVVKTYKEYVGSSLVVTTLTSCPDADCQTIINKQLEKEQKFRDDMKVAGDRRREEQRVRKLEDIKLLQTTK